MRAESGPMQFGEDWPGLFLRGDDAFGLAMMIKTHLEAPGPITELGLRAYAAKLESCDVRKNITPDAMKPYEECKT